MPLPGLQTVILWIAFASPALQILTIYCEESISVLTVLTRYSAH
jgi:hypothetical protein